MNTTMTLLDRLNKTQNIRQPLSARTAPSKISIEKSKAQRGYKRFTSLSKNEKLEEMRSNIKNRNPQWKHDYYRANNIFSKIEQEQLEQFPHNNKKYNIQFLDKTLTGGGLNFQVKDNGYFTKPKDNLYSKHYIPIVTQKRIYNEDYSLRTSLFGKTWVDHKRDRIMDQYQLQTNPFSTARSNQLICLMRPARKHRFS